jgi:general secretion pathway protein L
MLDILRRLLHLIRAFLKWWVSELRGMVPASSHWAKHPRATLRIDLRDDELAFASTLRGETTDLGIIPLSASREKVDALLGVLTHDVRLVRLRLPSARILRRRVEFPSLPPRELAQALALDMDRLTPFRADELYFDWHVAGRSDNGQRQTIDVMAVSRAQLAPVLERLADWEIPVHSVTSTDETTLGHDLLGRETRGETGRWSRRSTLSACIAGVLLFACIALPLQQRRTEAEDLGNRVSRARVRADEVIAMHESVERLDRAGRAWLALRGERPRAIAILNEMARVMPSDTWAYDISIDGRTVTVDGYGKSASSLIGRLDASPMFRSPAFRAATTQNPESGLERFPLTFALESGAAR